MLSLPLWICLISLIQSILPDCFVLSATIRAASNLTTCDIDTSICSTEMSIAAALTAPTDYLSFKTLDTGSDFKIYFENITVTYALSPFTTYSVVDGLLQYKIIHSCGNDKNPWLCEQDPIFSDARFKYKCWWRFYYDTGDTRCGVNSGGGYTCYWYWLKDYAEYNLYKDWGIQLDKLNFVYKKKAYSVRQHETVQLPDFNFTFVTGQAMTYPLENPAILVNPKTAHVIAMDKQWINGPNEFFNSKAGFFKNVPNTVRVCMDHMPTWQPAWYGVHWTGLSYLLKFPEYRSIPFSVQCPLNPNNMSTKLTNETIIGYSPNDQPGKNITYVTGSQDRTKVEINGLITDLCVSWPDICVCSSLTPLTCLDMEGIIRIKTPLIGSRMAYLKNQRIYAQSECKNPLFTINQVPTLVDVQIEGSNILPKVDVSRCKPTVSIKYDIDVLYIKANCSFLPCIVNTDTGFSMNVSANSQATSVDLEPSWKWAEVGCLRSVQRYYKNQAVNVTNVTGELFVNNTGEGGDVGGGGGSWFSGLFGGIGSFFGGVVNIIKKPFVWAWNLITDPLGFIGNIFSTLFSNIFFWILMFFGGLVSFCTNGILVTVVSEFVALQVYEMSTATAGIIALAGCLIGYKVLETLWSSRKQIETSAEPEAEVEAEAKPKAEPSTPLLAK